MSPKDDLMSTFRLVSTLIVGATFGWVVSTYATDAWVACAMLSGGCLAAFLWEIWQANRSWRAYRRIDRRSDDGRR